MPASHRHYNKAASLGKSAFFQRRYYIIISVISLTTLVTWTTVAFNGNFLTAFDRRRTWLAQTQNRFAIAQTVLAWILRVDAFAGVESPTFVHTLWKIALIFAHDFPARTTANTT